MAKDFLIIVKTNCLDDKPRGCFGSNFPHYSPVSSGTEAIFCLSSQNENTIHSVFTYCSRTIAPTAGQEAKRIKAKGDALASSNRTK